MNLFDVNSINVIKKRKCYIIIANSITGIGGGDIYTNNIIKSAKDKGYMPIVIHDAYGPKVFIKELEPYDKNICKYINLPPSFFTRHKLKRIIKTLISFVAEANSDSIIESQTVTGAIWGELIANLLNCRHLVRPLPEHNDIPNKEMYNFLKFKYDRQEFVGITPHIIPSMFANYWDGVNPPKGYSLPAHCTNVLVAEECPKKYIMNEADYTIGVIGRINKPFILPTCNSLVQFANLHKDKSINILFIGGRPHEDAINSITDHFSMISNVKLQITGQMYPIPSGLVRLADVYVSSAGSCYISYNCGIPTISVDTNDFKAIGIVGKTTDNTIFRDDEPQVEVATLLEDVLIKKKYVKEDYLNIITVDFPEHWEFIKQMSKQRCYFDVMSIPSIEKKEWRKHSYFLFNCFSYNHYMAFLHFYKKFLHLGALC